MARTSWFDDNANRGYPFLAETTGQASGADFLTMPYSAIVDCGFVFGLRSGYTASVHRIWLEAVSRSGDIVEFLFRTDAPSLVSSGLVFTRDLSSDPAFSTEHVELIDTGDGSSSCDVDEFWTGFVTTGPLDALANWIADGETVTGELYIEPATISSRVAAYARSISVANNDRTRAEPPDGCRDYCWPIDPQDVFVQSNCLTGPIRFVEGYNTQIRQNNTDNSLTFTASVGAGEGEPCEEVPVVEGEEPPTGYSLLTGGPSCGDLVRSINGVGGRAIAFLAGLGVRITTQPSSHKITINVDLSGLGVCDSFSNDSISCDDSDDSGSGDDDDSSSGDEDCECGEA